MYRAYAAVMIAILAPASALAQTLGTFRWQLQPYCNIVTLTIVQNGGTFTLDGFDDQCGAASRAPVTGVATPNPDGTIGIGLNIVVSPSGAPVHVATAVSLATLGGTWRDSAGATGTFAFTPGNGAGGAPRPAPSGIPSTITLLPDGGVVAGGTVDTGTIPSSGVGTRMMWYPGKAAFRAGQITLGPLAGDTSVGKHSAAFGLNTAAMGPGSVAFGTETLASGLESATFGVATYASGNRAFAIGNTTTASGHASVAMGLGTQAIGNEAVAAGQQTIASGSGSFAAGFQSVASASQAFAFGLQAQASGLTSLAVGRELVASGDRTVVLGSFARSLVAGAFVFGDSSTSAPVFAPAQNSFTVRAAGGYTLFTSSGLTTGATLAAGGSGWGVVSDANMKENFRNLDANDVLTRIARMPVREWNYKTQDAGIRHVGPTAQDFHAAFGLGEDRLRINTIDADGIALAGVKALESRSREQHDALVRENDGLKAMIDALKAEIAALRERLATLERIEAKRQ